MVAELETIPFAEKSGFRAAYLNDMGGVWHFHPEYELVLNISSFGTRIIGDNVELFDKYTMTFVAGNVPHSWNHYRSVEGNPGNHGIVCQFREEALGESLLSQYEMKALRELLDESQRGIAFSESDARRAEPLLHSMVSSTGMEKMVAFFSVMNVLCSSEKRRTLCSADYRSASDQRGNRRMTDVYTFIRENYSKPIMLKDAAAVANMSPFAFSRYFKKHSGAGLVEYINQVRSNRACYLLRETDHHVSEIAVMCGFQSISNFNRQFRKYNSTSPIEYRESYR